MGLLDRVNAALAESRGIEARAIGGLPWRPWDDPYWRFDVGGPVHPSRGGQFGVDGALRLQPVYSSVRILAEGVSMLPLQQFREAADGTKTRMPAGQLLSKPSAYLNVFDWLYQYITSAAFHGTAWGYITQRDAWGNPTTIEWLPPEHVVVEDPHPYNPAKVRIFFAGRAVAMSELFIVRAFTIPGRTAGISPLRYFQMLIQGGQDALAYGADWYKNGGFPPGTFQNTQYEVEKEQADQIKQRLVNAMRQRQPLVYGRDWEYKPITVPPDEAQFIQAMQLNATQIAAIYGVPPYRVGGTRGDSMTYSNVESEAIGLVQDTLDPWLVRLETALKDCLPGGQYAQFNRDARLRTTAQERWNVYQVARNIGAMNVDEIRRLEDKSPLPKPRDKDDYDGTDYTPLVIQVSAARGAKELLGEGIEGGDVPAAAPAAKPAVPQTAPLAPQPVPAANGNGNGSGSGS